MAEPIATTASDTPETERDTYTTSYVSRLPKYRVTLPCGHVFLSLTPSVALGPDGEPDDQDGLATFWCDHAQCRRFYFLEGWELHDHDINGGKPKKKGVTILGAEQPPLKRGRRVRRYAESELSAMYDAAVTKDRIAEWFLRHWDTIDIRPASALHHWRLNTMYEVAKDLGVPTTPAHRERETA